MRHFRRLMAAAASAALLTAAPAAGWAAAHRIVIRPTSLQPFRSHQDDSRYGSFSISGNGEPFWRELRLPVGARITGVSYQRIALDGSLTWVTVNRLRAEANPTTRTIFSADSSDVTPPDRAWTIVTGTGTGEPRRVRRGWTYFVLANTTTGNAAIGTITVRYWTP